MVQYKMDLSGYEHRSIELTLVFSPPAGNQEIAVPTFRPGRYQNGHYMRNIYEWNLKNPNGQEVPLHRNTPSTWNFTVEEEEAGRQWTLIYRIHAADFSAGSTYVDSDLIFINFPNVALLPTACMEGEIRLELNLPKGWSAIDNAAFNRGAVQFDSWDTFFDTPLIAMPFGNTLNYEVEGIPFYIHTYPSLPENPEEVVRDFEAFTRVQVASMGAMPFDSYHFVFFTTPESSYHGVEHHNSTVITLGPQSGLWSGDGYRQLLGIASHELFHAWNVKATRPRELSPIDFTREPIFSTGYVIEGVTTYLGDLMLIASAGYTWKQFAEKLATFIQRHADNDARQVRSVAQASEEIWTDGYELTVPKRMTSIYTEGALVAFMLDIMIRERTNGERGMVDVIRELWRRFPYPQGYSSLEYQALVAEFAGEEARSVFRDHVDGVADFFPRLRTAFHAVGLDLHEDEIALTFPRFYGLRARKVGARFQIYRVMEGSPADRAGLVPGWMISKINGEPVGERLSDALKEVHEPADIELEVITPLALKKIIIKPNPERYYPQYSLTFAMAPTPEQRALFHAWTGRDYDAMRSEKSETVTD